MKKLIAVAAMLACAIAQAGPRDDFMQACATQQATPSECACAWGKFRELKISELEALEAEGGFPVWFDMGPREKTVYPKDAAARHVARVLVDAYFGCVITE